MALKLPAGRKRFLTGKALTFPPNWSSNPKNPWLPEAHLLPQHPPSPLSATPISQSFSSSSQKFRRALRRHPAGAGLDPSELGEISNLIVKAASNAELRPEGVNFFSSILNCRPGFVPSAKVHNQIVDNLGRLGDYNVMFVVLNELSLKGHCLTENAFAFLKEGDKVDVEDSMKKVIGVLNRVGGSCRGSGIYSLIKLFCGMHSFDLAVLVMEESGRRTSYYNVLLAAKCRYGEFQDAHNLFDEMTSYGCCPTTSSYNYLLASLFKNKRFVEGCDLLQRMEEQGFFPDPITFEVVAVHACKNSRIDFAMELLNQMLLEGIKPRAMTHAAFIKCFFQSGRVEDAYRYVLDISARDPCSSNMNYSLLASLFQMSGRVVEAGRLLQEMMEKGLKPNFPVYIKVMNDLQRMNMENLVLKLKPLFSKFKPNPDVE